MSRKSKSKDHTKALNIPLTLTQGGLLQEALAVTVAKDHTQALNIPTLVGIVSVFHNLRSTLLLPFQFVSSAYLPPHMGTVIGMFNVWV
jgi:hypothetical protein